MQKNLDFQLSWKEIQTTDKNGPVYLDDKSWS